MSISQLSVLARFSETTSSATKARRTDQTLFASQLEKRIHDYRRGRADYNASRIDSEVARRDASVNATLASKDPKALHSYSAALTGIGYDRYARIVSSVEFTVRSLDSIPSQEQAQAKTDEIVAAFTKSGELK